MLGSIVGVGRTANIYAYGHGKIIKLYNDFCQPDWVETECRNAQAAIDYEVNTPKIYEQVEVDGKMGVVYDRVDGINLGDGLQQHPSDIEVLAKKAADEHFKIHQVPYKCDYNQSLMFEHRIKEGTHLSDEEKDTIIQYAKQLPDTSKLCHGDLHPENYILTEEMNLVVIDWMSGYSGHPAGDVCRVLLTLESPSITDGMEASMATYVRDMVKLYMTAYKNRYISLSGMSDSLINQFRLPFAALRLTENIEAEEEWLLAYIKEALNKL